MPPKLPPEVSLAQAVEWFGTRTTRRFNPDGTVSRLWLGLCRFPTLTAIDAVEGVEFYRFADGTVIRRADAATAPEIVGAGADGGLPAGVNEAHCKAWFGTETRGRFNLNGTVSRLWLSLGRFPALASIDEDGDAKYYRFADGTVLSRIGRKRPEIVGAGPGGNALPPGVSRELAARWFGTETTGRFNPEGQVSQLWLSVGRFPTLIEIKKIGEAEYYRFADGTIIFRPDPETPPRFVPEPRRKTGSLPIERIWGGVTYELTQEHGMTPFSQGEGAHFYGYTLVYCRDWCTPHDDPNSGHCPELLPSGGAGHPGLDIGIRFGTTLFTPVAGRVICAGTGQGLEGCGAFPCDPGSGNLHSGRFELELENGDRLIYGHLANIIVRSGDLLNAGDEIGLSGRDNGDHVHIEYRQRFPECQAGNPYLLVDPQDKFSKLV